MTERHYTDFAFQGEDITVTHEELLAERQIVRMPTGFSTNTAEQRLSVARMMPDGYQEKGEAPIICLPAFSDQPATRMDDSAAFRKLQANVSGRVIYTVNAPGVDMNTHERGVTSHTTPDQREELKRGVWCKTGRGILNAVRAADRHFDQAPSAVKTGLASI